MGNNPQPQPQPEPVPYPNPNPNQRVEHYDDLKSNVSKIKNVLKEMKNLDELNQDLKQELNNINSQFDKCLRDPLARKGVNFISRMNQDKPFGVGIYYSQNKKIYTVGSQTNGSFAKAFLTTDFSDVDQTVYSALFIDQTHKNGIFIKAKSGAKSLFVGSFQGQNEMSKGLLKQWNGRVEKKFKGSFVNGFLDGQGQLTIGDSSKYKGSFKKGNRDGFGVFKDFGQNILYIGQFESNEPHGYGEITYHCNEEKKSYWKGFWNNGVNEKGVFMDSEGKVIG